MEFLKKTEEKWQKNWEDAKIFEADANPNKPKFFITFPYAYMNGPLHIGHAFTASRTDAYARFKRMQGYNVLFPWAWHWTGQPLLGASNRIAKGDQEFIKALREVDGVTEQDLQKFTDPIYMATYYTKESRTAAQKIGFSVDWRRDFNTITPTYQKFVEWQYNNLRKMGYVSKGTHPVVWCPKDQSPTGDHDRQIGEGVTPEEYTLIKFKLDKETILPAATFRPETIYGATNMWLNPDATYVEAQVNNEKWIISQQAAEKLKEQGKTVKTTRTIKGKALIGKTFENPATKGKLLILPGWFVDPNQATGVVYSVPAHAPYDWLALKDLQEKPETLKEFNIDPETVKNIKPISLIKVEGYGEYPAIEITKQLNIKDQKDPKADEATNQLYKKEFHSGVLKETCREYSGKSVRDVKDTLIRDFKTRGIADSMYDLPQQVVCRCMTPCIVKVLQDQWFLNYSDLEWKAKTRQALNKMRIYPDTATQWFLTVIDWLKEWACARTTGFGTPLPWGKGWIIETLSDSTIYMAFYTLNKHIKQYSIKPEALTENVFNYIFYEKGDIKKIAEESGINAKILTEMHNEFQYWYPVDLRVSAKELVPNHLTFFIFHHVALFPPEQWPKAIGVNGMLMIEGKQMHKSKGNFVTMKKAVEQYGADATRCALLLAAEGMDDPDWRSDNAKDMQNKLEAFYNFAKGILENAKTDENGHLEKWLMSMLQHRTAEVTENLEEMKTRTALEIALFETWNDFRWYIRRRGKTETKTLKNALKTWLKLLAPFAPHLCEELWSEMKEKGFISLADWPKTNEDYIDVLAEEKENLIKAVIEDTLNVLKATKVTPQKICYYTASAWKWKVYYKMLEASKHGEVKMNEVMKELAKEDALKKNPKEIAKFASKMIKETNRMPETQRENVLKTTEINEKEALENAKEFLADRFNAQIMIYEEEDRKRYDPRNRAVLSAPLKPAIYIE
ncbi:MAG TPA: leucine--tRNA ligase [Candidatus Bathyarchaeia archaeon]|jgi:leucyl-tRNA synthetase|nr:leucine--tRNA ligase [Candidatus Bathyarchaeia archaeon]